MIKSACRLIASIYLNSTPYRLARHIIHITRISLANFRNYERLELDLQSGMTLFHGGNGEGKSNLIEAIYMLAIARSPRTANDRDLMRRAAADGGEAYARIAANVDSDGDPLRLQIDLVSANADASPAADGKSLRDASAVQKRFRVNGAPRRAAAFVGQLNAVMFSADDLEIVYGSPSARRRYLNILIAQADREYLRALRRYERIVRQRNHLLRQIRDGGARPDELGFWDDALIDEGKLVIARRRASAQTLSQSAKPIYAEMSGASETMAAAYSPNVPLPPKVSDDAIADLMRQRLAERRAAELARGVTLVGPHRDDLRLTLDDMDAAAFASRGQTRTLALALKLAEAEYLAARRAHQPVILMDDVLSELDANRRLQTLERASRYRQALITTADAHAVDARFLPHIARFSIRNGAVTPISN